MSVALTIILSVLNIITTILHFFGCYLLTYQYRKGKHNSQQLFLINLALTEGLVNLLQFIINTGTGMIPMSSENRLKMEEVRYYTKTLRGYGFVTVYFFTMIYLTLDKLFDIILNIKYHLYWCTKRTRYLLISTWALSISTAIAVCVVHYCTGIDDHTILDMYIYPIFDVLFILIACVTYGFIFHLYKRTRVPPARTSSSEPPPSAFQVFKASRFYIAVLLMTTFIFFMAIPEMIHLSVVVISGYHYTPLKIVLTILWALSYFSDAIIYIWMKPSVRKLMKKKLGLYHRVSSLEFAPRPFTIDASTK